MPDVGKFGACIPVFRPAIGPIAEKLRQGQLGFVENEMVDVGEIVRLHGEERTAGHHRAFGPAATGDQTLRGGTLHGHGADEGRVSPGKIVVGQSRHIQIHQAQMPVRRQHSGDGQESQRRKLRPFSHKGQRMLVAPEGVRKFRIQ